MSEIGYLVGTRTTGGHLRFASRDLALAEAHGWADADQCEVTVWACNADGEIVETDCVIKPSEYFYEGV